MGGDSYDRVYVPVKCVPGNNTRKSTSARSKPVAASAASAAALSLAMHHRIHIKANPKNRSVKCTVGKAPIIICSDMTGSMGDWPRVIFDKMPVLSGQIKMQGYAPDASFAFAGIGDTAVGSHPDKPFQITDFGQGIACDELLNKIGKASGYGPSNGHEAYDLAAFYFASRVSFPNLESPVKPILIMFVDEFFRDKIRPGDVKRYFGVSIEKPIDSRDMFRRLCQKYEVFVLQKPATDWKFRGKRGRGDIECKHLDTGHPRMTAAVLEKWQSAVGAHRVLCFKHAKACVDVMLGAVALSTGARSLQAYLSDMRTRGQTNIRMEVVRRALLPYASHEGIVTDADWLQKKAGSVRSFDTAAASAATAGKGLFAAAVGGEDDDDDDDEGPY